MRVLFLHLVFTLPRKLRTSLGVPMYFDDQDTTLLQTFDLTVHDLDRFFDEVEFFIDLDFFQRLDAALDLEDLLGCLVDDLWASELTISNFSPADRGHFNGHIRAAADGYAGVHGGFGFGDRNKEGRTILEFATAHEMVAANSFFRKSEAHLITFQNVLFEKRRHRREVTERPRILWKNLKGEAVETFRANVSKKLSDLEDVISSHNAVRCGTPLMTLLDIVKMPDEWKLSEVIPIYKNKGDAQACSNYKGIKLLSYTMKLWARVIERRLRRETRVPDNQFGFMPGRSTTEVIHLLRSLMKKYRKRQRDLHMAFLDLEKAYDSVPRELVWRTLRDKGTPRRYSRVIKDMVAIRPAMLYGLECWPITKAQANRVEVAKLRMLRWTCGKTMVDMIPNGVFRAELDVNSIIDKMREGRGGPKLRWEDRLKQDIKELLLSEDMTSDRNAWRDRIRITG
nr:integrator complex subunit 11 [Tanacetum cinerariifolium]